MVTSSCVQLVQAQREYTAGTERLEEANKMTATSSSNNDSRVGTKT